MGTTIEKLRQANDGVGPNLPMYNVSWHDATEFCYAMLGNVYEGCADWYDAGGHLSSCQKNKTMKVL